MRPRARLAASLAVTASVVGILLAGCTSVPAHLTAFTLPEPGGPHPLGVTTIEVPASPSRGTARTMAQLWYPAADRIDGATAAYVEPVVAAALEEQLAGHLGWSVADTPDLTAVATHAHADADAAADGIPLVVFSPGLDTSRALYTSTGEGLASRGIAVLAVDHPGDATAIAFPDGTTTRGTLAADIDAAATDRARIEALSETATATRASEMLAALDTLDALVEVHGDTALPKGLAAALRATDVVMMGHSLGGAAAIAAAEDARIGGAVDLDGTPWGSVVDTGLDKPLLVVTSDDTDLHSDAHLSGLASRSPLATTEHLAGSRHLSFTDWVLLQPQLGSGGEEVLGTMDPAIITSTLAPRLADFTVSMGSHP